MKCSAIFDVEEQPNSLYLALDVVERNIFFAFSVQLLLPLTEVAVVRSPPGLSSAEAPMVKTDLTGRCLSV